MDKRKHFSLLLILISIYTILPTFIGFRLRFNYVSWFVVIYFISSYIRLYGFGVKISHKAWGWMTVASVLLASVSVLSLFAIYKLGYMNTFMPYFFISDSNKILALLIAVTSFMYFKGLKMPHSRFINAVGATTFGVLLIHANSDAMRQWLWRESVNCVGHFGDSVIATLEYAILSVLIIFAVCAAIDWLRARYIEPPLLAYANRLIHRKQQITT